jgi:hypothetical protein
MTAFVGAGVKIATNYPTLIQRTDPALSPESDEEEVVSIPTFERYPALYLYDRLKEVTGLDPKLTSLTPRLVNPNPDDHLLKPGMNLFPKRYQVIAVTAPTVDHIHLLWDWTMLRIQRTAVICVVLNSPTAPAFPNKPQLGEPSPASPRTLLRPPMAEVIDAIHWSAGLLTTEQWAMYLAVGCSIPVDFAYFDNPPAFYDKAYFSLAQPYLSDGVSADDLPLIRMVKVQ